MFGNLSFLDLEGGISFHNILKMFINEGIEPWKIVFIVDYSLIGVFVGGEIDEIFSFLFVELNAWSF